LYLLGLQRLDTGFDAYSTAVAIDACDKAGDVDGALDVLHSGLEGADGVCFNSAMAACARRGLRDRALQVLETMKERGVQPDTFTFNILLHAHFKARDGDGALRVFELMRAADPRAPHDAVTVNTLTTGFVALLSGNRQPGSSLSAVNRALDLCDDIDLGVTRHSGSGSDGESSSGEVRWMYHVAINSFLRQTSGSRTATDGGSKKLFPSMSDHNCLASEEHRSGWLSAINLVEIMGTKHHLKPNLETFSLFTHAALDQRNWENLVDTIALALRQDGDEEGERARHHQEAASESVGFTRDDDRTAEGALAPLVVSDAIRRGAETKRAQEALRLLREFTHLLLPSCLKEEKEGKGGGKGLGKQPSSSRGLSLSEWHALLECVMVSCVKRRYIGDARKVMDLALRHASDPQTAPLLRVFTLAIKSCGAKVWRAKKYLDLMLDLGLAPNATVFAAALTVCAKAKRWKEAKQLLQDMIEAGVTPNEVAYASVMQACKQAGQWEEALELLRTMRVGPDAAADDDDGTASTIPMPNLVCYTTVLAACRRAKQPEHVLNLLADMAADGVLLDEHAYSIAITCLADDDGHDGHASRYAGRIVKLFEEMEGRGLEPNLSNDCHNYAPSDPREDRSALPHVQAAAAAYAALGNSSKAEELSKKPGY
jgi:pentatricopeptide repeat protein